MRYRNIFISRFTIMILILIISCKSDQGEMEFLQKGKIQLAAPRLDTDNTIISEDTYLTMGPEEKGLELRYSDDGSIPTESSKLYLDPIKISKSGTYKVKAFHENWLTSELSEIQFFEAGIKPKTISLTTTLDERYPGQGPETLINLRKGGNNFSDGEWIGIQRSLEAIVEFETAISIESVLIGYLTNPGSWIFPPSKIDVFGSDDGKNFENLYSYKFEEVKEGIPRSHDHLLLKLNTRKRYIKINIENLSKIPKWHEGAGTAGWLFMDEWIFN